MTTAEQNFQLLQEIEANRDFLLMAYEQNPRLLKLAEPRIKQLFDESWEQKGHLPASAPSCSQRGISLIELIMFIVIVSVALAGILLVMNVTTKSSADPLVHKQALAIAESLLEEVELMPFTICDPDDPNAASAATAADCTGGTGGANDESAVIGPEGAGSVGGAEGRYAAPQFDNVSDYHNFSMSGAGGIRDITNTSISAALDGYSATVAIAAANFGGITAASGNALLITVTVTGPDGVDVVVEGIRTRYAPRALP